MISFPKAKINLGLMITGKRQDGFHEIETIFYPIGLCDALEFVERCKPGAPDHIKVTGIIPESSTDTNLVIKALDRIRSRFNFPVLDIHLHKAIPIGAGLGGGSSDGACMLKTLNRKYNFSLTDKELSAIALELGSDCPFFIKGIPSLATGRGEILKDVDPVLKGKYLVLLNPGIHISTREAYANCRPLKRSISLEEYYRQPVEEWKDLIKNDFEDYAFSKYPDIKALKEEFYKSGAIFSLMTGSGSSVYGIFTGKPKLPVKLAKYLVWEGFL